jgi:hypothetical protein
MSTHIVSTSHYLMNTSAVLAAGRQLQNMMGEDYVQLDYAVTQLEEAANAQDAGATNYRALMFSALEQSKPAQKETRERITEDVFATVLADLQIGGVLVAAGHDLGEADGQTGGHRLAEALDALEQTTPVIARGLSMPLSAGPKPGRFNFSGSTDKTETPSVQSPDPKSARDAFEQRAKQTLDTFVGELRGVAVSVVDALKKLSPDKILEALESFGGPVKSVTGMVKRLLKKGLDKMQAAIDALVRLIGSDALTKVKERVVQFWNEAADQKLSELGNALIAKVIGVEATTQRVRAILSGGELDKDAVDKASDELAQLVTPYAGNMAMAKKAVEVISFVSGILVLTPIAGQKVALFAAGSYFLILGAVFLIAMDYTDSGRVLQRVRGVGEIAGGLRPAGEVPPSA